MDIYEYQDGVKKSRTHSSCGYIQISTPCTTASVQYYDYDYDDDGNIIAEYLVNNEGDKHSPTDEPVAIHTYSEAYLAKQAAANCGATKSCTSCSGGKILQDGVCVSSCGANYKLDDGICYRIRYTPAEAAEVAGETNTIFLYYK